MLPSQRVSIATKDGVKLVGSFVPAKTSAAPGVLLLHMLGRDHSTWDALRAVLREEGFASLAIDFRGHGGSTKGMAGSISWENFTDEQWKTLPLDGEAALAFLLKQRGVSKSPVGVVGASIGANVALQVMAQNQNVTAAVLLSPGLDYRGVTAEQVAQASGARPVIIVAAKEDSYSHESSEKLATQMPGASFVSLDGDAHGTAMLDAQPDLLEDISHFLAEHVLSRESNG